MALTFPAHFNRFVSLLWTGEENLSGYAMAPSGIMPELCIVHTNPGTNQFSKSVKEIFFSSTHNNDNSDVLNSIFMYLKVSMSFVITKF